MSQTIQSEPLALIERVARFLPPKAQEDFRILLGQWVLGNLTAQAPGGNLLRPGGTPAGASAPPSGVTHSVVGANGVLTVSINNPPHATTPIYHEFSISPLKSFTQNVVTFLATVATSLTIAASGQTVYTRLRSSFDRKTWTPYQLSSTSPIVAGLVQSSAIAPGAAFNQTNFAAVNSQASGGSALVTISGTGGNLTPYTAIKGSTQNFRPSATIVGIPASVQRFVGWDGSQFQVKPTLAAVLADNLEPVGAVSVVSTATPTLPTIVPIVSSGQIIGYNVTNGGAGASQPYVLTLGSTGGGTGATFGAQNIQNGVLISVAPGNPGSGYSGGTTVTASGGSPGGQSGGGGVIGGNPGRLVNV